MYSTNLQPHNNVTLFDGKGNCVGTAYGFEYVNKDDDGKIVDVGPPTQTAKDNALLWSLAPEMVELLQEALDHVEETTYRKCSNLLMKLAHAIPSASVAADA